MAHEGTRTHGAGSASGTRTRGPGLDFTTYSLVYNWPGARYRGPQCAVSVPARLHLASRCAARISRAGVCTVSS